MRINKFSKNIIITSMVFGAMVLSGTTSSKAVLQSNGNDGATYNLNDWMINVRKMEQLGGAMGLSETLNSNLTSSSDSNNIDVHMQKNTEYGALAILSASSYGNPNKVNDGETTTGNVTGVVMKFNSEWVAAGNLSGVPNCANAVGRYKNYYENKWKDTSLMYYLTYNAVKGDAIVETKGWHGSSVSQFICLRMSNQQRDWLVTNYMAKTGLVRSIGGSIFSYDGNCGTVDGNSSTISNKGTAYFETVHKTRAVIVQGEGI